MSEAPDRKEALDDEWLKVALHTAAMRQRLHKHLIAEALRHGFQVPRQAPSSDTPASAQTPQNAPVPRSK